MAREHFVDMGEQMVRHIYDVSTLTPYFPIYKFILTFMFDSRLTKVGAQCLISTVT